MHLYIKLKHNNKLFNLLAKGVEASHTKTHATEYKFIHSLPYKTIQNA